MEFNESGGTLDRHVFLTSVHGQSSGGSQEQSWAYPVRTWEISFYTRCLWEPSCEDDL